MFLSASLHAICDLLKRETALAAQAGLPSGAGKRLFVWPYRLELTAARSRRDSRSRAADGLRRGESVRGRRGVVGLKLVGSQGIAVTAAAALAHC